MLLFYQTTFAHFGMLIPSDNMVMQDDNRVVNLQLSFSHPMEMVGMEMVKPKTVQVFSGGRRHDLLNTVTPIQVMGHSAWHLDYRIKRPGIYIFSVEPQPYWEPAEDVFIIHYTKTVLAAFGDDEGWDKELGMITEIVPLSKPFGLYAGNVFQGIVKLKGKAVADAEVEVEFYNQGKTAQAPTQYMVTQTIKADHNGVFTYAAPKSGWWGFAALNQADFKLKTNSGEEKSVELGAVLWVHFEPWKSR
jgi:cobalt/nickel transport protein